MIKSVKELALVHREYAIAMRREFHRHPELSLKEFETSARIKRELERMGISFQSVAETGIVAEIKGEGQFPGKGKTIALRADMDALEIEETTDLEFSSESKGVMHACGHDVHTAALLTAANILNQIKDQFAGTIKLIFQPAEELVTGATKMMEANPFMDDVDAILGLHVTPDYPAGYLGFRDGGLMFAGEMFRIKVKGKSGHGSQPNTSVDALLAASAIVMNSQSIISRERDPRETAVVTICTMQAGTRHNIMAGDAEMKGTLRCYSEQTRNELRQSLTRIAENTAKAYRATAVVEYEMYVPAVVNDPSIGRLLRRKAEKIVTTDEICELGEMTGSDDFAYYMEKVPGYYVFVGCGDADPKRQYPIHNSGFYVNEDCLPVAASVYAQFALDLLEEDSCHK